MRDIDNIAVDITQCYGILTGVVISSDDITKMYASHRLRILLWSWAATVSAVCDCLVMKLLGYVLLLVAALGLMTNQLIGHLA